MDDESKAASFDGSGYIIEMVDPFAWSGAQRPTDADLASLSASTADCASGKKYGSGKRQIGTSSAD